MDIQPPAQTDNQTPSLQELVDAMDNQATQTQEPAAPGTMVVPQPPVVDDPLTITSTLPQADQAPVEPAPETASVSTPPDVAVAPPIPQEATASNTDEPTIISEPEPASAKDAAWIDDSQLEAIKLAALKELAPIADKLDQTPEERFDTLFRLIQATDSVDLVQPALDAAKAIQDEKARAQALLDIVHEVDFLEKRGQSDQ